MSMTMLDRLAALEARFEELTAEMGEPEVATDHERLRTLAQERAALEEIVNLYRDYADVAEALHEARTIVDEGSEADLVALAREEIAALTARQEDLENRLKLALLPRDPRDDRDVIVEIRAATRGEEAGLFAADLYPIYSTY